MEIRIKTDLTSEPVSTDEVKQFIKFTYDTVTDEVDLLEQLIKAVRTYLERESGLTFSKKTFEIYFDGDEDFTLPVYPVISVSSVQKIARNGDTETAIYETAGNYEKRIFTEISETSQLKVTCMAGYGESETETLPEDLKQAILKQVAKWYYYRDDFAEGNYLPEVKNIINVHKRDLI
jgi:uncharacterized phiE125 gp8 family phage protein